MWKHRMWIMVFVAAFFAACFLLLTWPTGGKHVTPFSPASSEQRTKSDPSDQRPPAVELRIGVAVSPDEFAVIEQWNEQYRLQHKNVNIQLENIPAVEAYQHFMQEAERGDAHDIMLLQNEWIGEFAGFGYLSPVGELFKSEVQADLLPPLMSQVKWNGYIWGVPKDIDLYMMVRNEQRIGEPNLIWRWTNISAFLQFVRSASSISDESSGFALDPQDPLAWLAFNALFAEDAGIHGGEEWLQAERVLAGQFGRLAQTAEADGKSPQTLRWEALNRGRTAMMMTTVSEYVNYADKQTIRIVPLPETAYTQEKQPLWITGRSFVVYAGTSAYQEAAEWIRFMTREQAQLDMWAAGGMLPVKRSVYQQPSVLLSGETDLAALLAGIPAAETLPLNPHWPKTFAEFRQGIEEWHAVGKSVPELIGTIQQLKNQTVDP